MNNLSSYNRSPHDTKHPYLKIASRLITDKRLNAIAIGLMAIILNNADTYIINKKDIQARSNLNGNQFRVTWELLINTNYIEAIYRGNHKWEYIINEDGESKTLPVTSCKTLPVASITITNLTTNC